MSCGDEVDAPGAVGFGLVFDVACGIVDFA
jgi:hypothetical protein